MQSSVEIRIGDRTVSARVSAEGRVSIDAEQYDVTQVEPGLYRVTSGTRRCLVAVAGPPEDRWIAVDGRVARVEVVAAGGRKRPRSSGHAAMMAPMPATVVKILIEPGAAVTAGQTLVVLEAMKMELPIRSPRDGVVRAVLCRQGELVQPGVNLLELDA